MANNCIVKKLTGVFSDPDLFKLNEVRLSVGEYSGSTTRWISLGGTRWSANNDNVDLEVSGSVTFTGTDISNDFGRVSANKYKITRINAEYSSGTVKVENSFDDIIKHCSNLIELRALFAQPINLNSIKGSPCESKLRNFWMVNNVFTGDLSAFSDCSDLDMLQVQLVPGDISVLGHLYNLNTLTVINATGSLYTLASIMVGGRNSGTLQVNLPTDSPIERATQDSVAYIYFGTTMSTHNPTAEELKQGWCVR